MNEDKTEPVGLTEVPESVARPAPVRLVVVCEVCGGETEMRASDGRVYHVAGEGDHEPRPVKAS